MVSKSANNYIATPLVTFINMVLKVSILQVGVYKNLYRGTTPYSSHPFPCSPCKDHKELKSARDPNVGPPDRPNPGNIFTDFMCRCRRCRINNSRLFIFALGLSGNYVKLI